MNRFTKAQLGGRFMSGKYFLKGVLVNLFWRFLLLLFWAIGHLLWVLLAAVVQFLLLPVLIAILRLLRGLFLFSLAATVTGPRQYIDRLAGEWTQMIHEGTSDRDNINEVFQLCRVLVGTLIVLGWLVAAFFTYSILRVAFGFFI